MTESAEETTVPAAAPPRRRRARDAALEGVSVAALAFVAVGTWLYGHVPDLAEAAAEDYLRQQGVEADIAVERLDNSGFAGALRLGPKGEPVVVAKRIEVAYDLTPPWAGGPPGVEVTALRLVEPDVRARLTADGKISLGQLDPLIDAYLKQPRRETPGGPAILLEAGRVLLATPQGNIRVTGGGALDDGFLLRFDGALAPTRLKSDALAVDIEGGGVRLRKDGAALRADVRLAVEELTGADLDIQDGEARLEATLPYPDLRKLSAAGPADAVISLRGDSLRAGAARLGDGEARLRLTGELAGDLKQAAFRGRLSGDGRADAFEAADVQGRGARFAVNFPQLTAIQAGQGLKLTGEGGGRVQANALAAGAAVVRGADIDARLHGFTFADGAAGSGVAATIKAGEVVSGDVRLVNLVSGVEGRFHTGQDGLTLGAVAAVRAHGAFRPEAADRLAASLPEPGYAAAVGQALRGFDLNAPRIAVAVEDGRTTAALPAPAVASTAEGGRVVLAAGDAPLLRVGQGGALDGAARLTVQGGGLPQLTLAVPRWRMAGGALDADFGLTGQFDLAIARGASLDAAGRLRLAGGDIDLALSRCVEARVKTVELGENDLADLRAHVCASGGPLLSVRDGAWRVAGLFSGASAAMPGLDLSAEGGAGRFEAHGTKGLDGAAVQLDRAAVTDTAESPRFAAVQVRGEVGFSQPVWRGGFQASAAGRPVATVTLRHDVARGRGGLAIEARQLDFAPGGLQPADLSPLLVFAAKAQGRVAFQGRMDWSDKAATSSGKLTLAGLSFTSPAGQVDGVNGEVRLSSLAPLTAAPEQVVTVDKLTAVVPLTSARAVFGLTPEGVDVREASVILAKGKASLEPTVIPMAPGKPISGVIGLDRVDAGELVAGSNLADKVKLQAVVSGRVPFTFSDNGLELRDGKLTAVQPGRLSIDREVLTGVAAASSDAPGAPPPTTAEPFNAVQDMAYQALEALAFEHLDATLNSQPGGRLGILFHIQGHHDPAVKEQAKLSLIDLIRGRAFNKRIALPSDTPIDLTLDTSLNFAELLKAYQNLWRQDAAGSAAVQPQGATSAP